MLDAQRTLTLTREVLHSANPLARFGTLSGAEQIAVAETVDLMRKASRFTTLVFSLTAVLFIVLQAVTGIFLPVSFNVIALVSLIGAVAFGAVRWRERHLLNRRLSAIRVNALLNGQGRWVVGMGRGKTWPVNDGIVFAKFITDMMKAGGGTAVLRITNPDAPNYTPDAVVENDPRIRRALAAARDAGFTISLDTANLETRVTLTREN